MHEITSFNQVAQKYCVKFYQNKWKNAVYAERNQTWTLFWVNTSVFKHHENDKVASSTSMISY